MTSVSTVPKTNLKKITGYLDNDLYERFIKLADLESRSISQMMVHLVKQAIKKAEDEGKLPTRSDQPEA